MHAVQELQQNFIGVMIVQRWWVCVVRKNKLIQISTCNAEEAKWLGLYDMLAMLVNGCLIIWWKLFTPCVNQMTYNSTAQHIQNCSRWSYNQNVEMVRCAQEINQMFHGTEIDPPGTKKQVVVNRRKSVGFRLLRPVKQTNIRRSRSIL